MLLTKQRAARGQVKPDKCHRDSLKRCDLKTLMFLKACDSLHNPRLLGCQSPRNPPVHTIPTIKLMCQGKNLSKEIEMKIVKETFYEFVGLFISLKSCFILLN